MTTMDFSMTAEQVAKFQAWARHQGDWREERANTFPGNDIRDVEWRREKRREAQVFGEIAVLISKHVAEERKDRGLAAGGGEPIALPHQRAAALHAELATWAARSGHESEGEFACQLAMDELSSILGRTPGELLAAAPPKPPGPPPVLLSWSIGGTTIVGRGESVTPEEERRRIREALALSEAASRQAGRGS